MIIYIVILEDNPPFREFETQDKEQAIKKCRSKGIPHFYELDSNDRVNPKRVWHVTKDSVTSKTWAETVAEHDRH